MFYNIALPSSAEKEIYEPALTWWSTAVVRLGNLPSRRDLEPHYLGAKGLPHVLLVDIIGNADELRFRLMGSNHTSFNGRDLTGLLFSQVYPAGSPVLSYLRTLYRELIYTRRPLWSLTEFIPPTREFNIRMGRLMLPLSSDGETVDLCVSIQKIESPQNATAPINPWQQSRYTGEIERAVL